MGWHPHRWSRHADQRPYVVADRLDDLQGPPRHAVSLDRQLDWSGPARYDLDKPACW
ncbi:hypothetical protein ONO86_03220 [Micromonospora noduli]|nr:hypothetical protein ONO86_03220 [Micromonospora noduli]